MQLLRLIEETPLSIDTSRSIILLISKVEKLVAAEGMQKVQVTISFFGLLGVLHNRFEHLWNPTSECLAFLIRKHPGVVSENFLSYLEQCQSSLLASAQQFNSDEPGHSTSGMCFIVSHPLIFSIDV